MSEVSRQESEFREVKLARIPRGNIAGKGASRREGSRSPQRGPMEGLDKG